jgi:UDP-hydrolysing UDP-N-acetyl-D-glucosamine 2-epimerase
VAGLRRVAVVTGTRAEYGLLYWLIHDLRERPGIELQLIVTGTHLAPAFGNTVDAIEADGFSIAARFDIIEDDDTPAAMCASAGRALTAFGATFARLKPDVLVVLGDRYEAHAAATAALISGIPIAHLHGGEASEGVIDEALRHAITKMANLHFTSAEPYRDRVIQLGERPELVFTVGALAAENLARTPLLEAEDIANQLGLGNRRPLFVVTYHPEPIPGQSPVQPVRELLAALDAFPEAAVVLTKSNADAGGRAINGALDAYAQEHPDRVCAVPSLGRVRYLSLLRAADVAIGNSSSGIVEAPLVGTPTVNIGDRQRGRLRTPSIVQTDASAAGIEAAIGAALVLERSGIAAAGRALYGSGGGVARIVAELEAADLSALRVKSFYTFR